MNDRGLAPSIFLLVVVGSIASGLVLAQSATPTAPSRKPAKPWTAPRTPDGQPDLQGFWSNTTYVPLERPKGVTKEFYTPEEAAEMVKRAAAAESEQTEPGTVADVHYDFTQFGLDRSQSDPRAEFAHVAYRRSARWQNASAYRRRAEASGRAC